MLHTEHNLAGFRPDSPVRNKISNSLIVSDLTVVWGLLREILSFPVCLEDDLGCPDFEKYLFYANRCREQNNSQSGGKQPGYGDTTNETLWLWGIKWDGTQKWRTNLLQNDVSTLFMTLSMSSLNSFVDFTFLLSVSSFCQCVCAVGHLIAHRTL